MTPLEFQALADEHGGLVPAGLAAHLTGVTYARIQQLVHTHRRLTPVIVNNMALFSVAELKQYHAERMEREKRRVDK